jgi:hypothetical protein
MIARSICRPVAASAGRPAKLFEIDGLERGTGEAPVRIGHE